MANLRGLTIKRGVNMRPIQTANMAKAARSRPPNTSNRSHRLTVDIGQRTVNIPWQCVELVSRMGGGNAGTPICHNDHACAVGF